MMGATLGAPLAALMAILELAANPNSILPGMVVIVTLSGILHGILTPPRSMPRYAMATDGGRPG